VYIQSRYIDICKNICLEILVQLANAEIARSNIATRIQIWDRSIEFNFSGLPLHLRQKKDYELFFEK